MKSRSESLIRLKKFQVDEKRRQVTQIEMMIADFERMASELDQQIEIEQQKTGISDVAHFAYSTFAKAAIARRDNLLASIQMVVSTMFWFHPLVWLIGARLFAKRRSLPYEHTAVPPLSGDSSPAAPARERPFPAGDNAALLPRAAAAARGADLYWPRLRGALPCSIFVVRAASRPACCCWSPRFPALVPSVRMSWPRRDLYLPVQTTASFPNFSVRCIRNTPLRIMRSFAMQA